MNETMVPTLINPAARDATTGRFLAGNGGNGGRKCGTRNALGQQLVDNLEADFRAHGAKVIAAVRRDDPSAYLTIVARLLPAEVAIGAPSDFASCSTAEEVLDQLLGEFVDPRDALASFDAMRALLVERIAAEARQVEYQALPTPRVRAE